MTIKLNDIQKVYYKNSLKNLKHQGHEFFDKLWKLGLIERNEAYLWLSQRLGVAESQAHFTKMDKNLCKEAIRLCIQILNDNKQLDKDFGVNSGYPYYELQN